MRLDHARYVASILGEGDRGDFITLDPLTSSGKTIHGHFSYETTDGIGVELRIPIMRIARLEAGEVPHGTTVWITSDIHDLKKAKHEVDRRIFDDSATVTLELKALD